MCPSSPVRAVLVLGAVLIASQSRAQVEAESPPDSLVLAVRVVSEDRVRPTTGVVISKDGLLLLPLDFVAAPGGPIYVLDGGADLARDGRSVEVLRTSRIDGIALARAEGLEREPIVFASERPADDSVLRLSAYSDATSMQAGRLFTRRHTRVRLHAGHDTLVLARGFPLPNVSGALTDGCDHLVGLSLARGTSTAASTGNTSYLWLNRLRAAVTKLGVSPATASCDRALEWRDPPPLAAVETQPPPSPGESAADEGGAATEKIEPVEDQPASAPQPPPSEPARQTSTVEPTARSGPRSSRPPAELVRSAQEGLAQLGLYRGAIDGKLGAMTRASLSAFHVQADLPADEPLSPATVRLMAGQIELQEAAEREAELRARLRTLEQQNAELEARLAAQPDDLRERLLALGPGFWAAALLLLVVIAGVARRSAAGAARPEATIASGHALATPFVIVGQLADGAAIRAPVEERDGRIDALIGRSNASILIPDESVGRQHARIQGPAEDLMLTDLGSVNGTWVNDEACERGTPRPLRAGDEIVVGGVHLRIEANEA